MNTENTQEVVDISKLSTKELEELVKKRKAKEAKKLEQERIAYEESRDKKIDEIMITAITLSRELAEFKQLCHIEMDAQSAKLADYGKIRSNSKGGFLLKNSDDSLRVIRRRDTEPSWDERAVKGEALIKDFLADTIKKKDLKLYEILIGFLERNSNGDLEYSRVMDLYKHEEKYDDPRWKEGLRLMKESFSNHFKAFGYEFKKRNPDTGKYENVLLNFSSL
jgi:hypothetical protein